MEDLVEQYASKLMSNESASTYEIIRGLEELKGQGAQDGTVRVKYSRLLQELLAYKGGALVTSVLQKVSDFTVSPGELTVDVDACLKLVAISDSQMVARFCLQEVKDALLLVAALMGAHNAFMVSLEGQDRLRSTSSCTKLYFALLALRGIVNFARASKDFCRKLQEISDLFPAFEYLLDRFATTELAVPFNVLDRAADDAMRLISTFALSEECKDWAIDRGLIRVRAAMMRLALKGETIEQHYEDRKKTGSHQNLMQPAEVRTYLAHSAQGLLETDRQIRNPKTEKRRSKKLREGFIGNIRKEMCLGNDPKDLSTKVLAARATGRIEAPIVCSWDLCDAGSALDAGKPYSKCANCSLAIYCSKEHQKMHWTTHKNPCKQAASVRESGHDVASTNGAAVEQTTCSVSQKTEPVAAAVDSSPRPRKAPMETRVQQKLGPTCTTDDVGSNKYTLGPKAGRPVGAVGFQKEVKERTATNVSSKRLE